MAKAGEANYSRVEMTDSQKEVYKNFIEALKACEDADIYLHADEFGNLQAYNGLNIHEAIYKGRRRNVGEFFPLNFTPFVNGKIVEGFKSEYVPCFKCGSDSVEPDVLVLRTESKSFKYRVYKGTEKLTDDLDSLKGWEYLTEHDSLPELREHLRIYFDGDSWFETPEELTRTLRYEGGNVLAYCNDRDEVLRIESVL